MAETIGATSRGEIRQDQGRHRIQRGFLAPRPVVTGMTAAARRPPPACGRRSSRTAVVRRDDDDRHLPRRPRDRPVLPLARRIPLGVDVGISSASRAFHGQRKRRAAAEIEDVEPWRAPSPAPRSAPPASGHAKRAGAPRWRGDETSSSSAEIAPRLRAAATASANKAASWQ